MMIYYNGARITMIVGGIGMTLFAITYNLVFFYVIDDGALGAMSMIFGFLAGVGTIFVEEGLYAYLGVDEKQLSFSNADKYFEEDMIKMKGVTQSAMRFSSFLGTLIAFLVSPRFLTPGDGDTLATLIPSITLAGLMVILVAPPPRNISKKEKHANISNYKNASSLHAPWEMVRHCFIFETMYVFPFIFLYALYTGLIECCF